jgi:hypothetical protein
MPQVIADQRCRLPKLAARLKSCHPGRAMEDGDQAWVRMALMTDQERQDQAPGRRHERTRDIHSSKAPPNEDSTRTRPEVP